jgi:hypothetical protein
LTGSADVHATTGGIQPTVVRLQPGPDVAGRLNLATVNVAFDRARVRVTLVPVSTAADGEVAGRMAVPDATGRFVIPDVLPTRYRVEVAGLPPGWKVASAIFNGTDAADYLLAVDTDRRYDDGVVTFTSRSSDVSGALVTGIATQPAPSGRVIIFPDSGDLRVPSSRRIHVVPVSAGRYSITGLPAGDYRLAAVDDVEPGQQFDRGFLTELQPRAVLVTLGDGDKKVQDLPVR